MPFKSIYEMTNKAIAIELANRIEQLRLEQNISQKSIANEIGITDRSYRNFKKGQATLETVIGILRVLGRLENLNNFIPEEPISPLALLETKSKLRARASKQASDNDKTNDKEEW